MNTNHFDTPSTARRYRTQEHAHVEICGRHDKFFCKLENLSTTGAALRIISAQSVPRPKDILKLTVTLKSINKVHIMYAEIIWINGLDLGSSFISSEMAQRKITNNVQV
jgi:hypothetical protein